MFAAARCNQPDTCSSHEDGAVGAEPFVGSELLRVQDNTDSDKWRKFSLKRTFVVTDCETFCATDSGFVICVAYENAV